jgi:hypothetical protein
MPASFIHDPQHWRERAAEMRKLAEGGNDSAAKETMLRIAPTMTGLPSGPCCGPANPETFGL